MQEGSRFSTSSPASIVSWFVHFIHSDQRDVISQCGFHLYFPDNEWCWASFHVSVGHLDVFFGKSVYSYLLPISSLDYLFFRCWVWWVLYRFWILALYPMCHLQISFPILSVAFQFCWLFPLQCRSSLSLWGPNSLFLLLIPLPLGMCQVRNCCGWGQRGFPAFSSRVWWFPVSHSGPLSILSLFLWMVANSKI